MKEYRYTKPVEMPRSTHYGNNYYVIPSRKLKRNVSAFSFLEYANILTLEMNPLVEFYCEQPCTVDVYVDGRKFNTTFDVYVVYTDGREEMMARYRETSQREHGSSLYLIRQHDALSDILYHRNLTTTSTM